jgi:hypothetical protein
LIHIHATTIANLCRGIMACPLALCMCRRR